jgi:EpsI family protein
MSKVWKAVALALAMCTASGMAAYMKPTILLSEVHPHPKLDSLVPRSFGDWQVDTSIVPVVSDPNLDRILTQIYAETLSRTYRDKQGNVVMLALAYGSSQTKDLQLHRPEICYSAQGFQIKGSKPFDVVFPDKNIKATQLLAVQGERKEHIVYWMRIGDAVASTGMEQAMLRYRYGIKGYIPDGLLFRVSVVSDDEAGAQQLIATFVKQLYQVVPTAERNFVFGTPSDRVDI